MSRRKISLFITILTMAASLAAFQNCSKGFKSQSEYSVSSSADPIIDPNAPLGVYAIDEGTVTNHTMAVVFKLNKVHTSDVVVTWNTVNGTAKAGYNYTAASSTTTIPAGKTSATSTILGIVSDYENNLDFTVQVTSAGTDAAIARATADFHIAVDSAPFVLENKWYPMSMTGAFATPRQGYSTVWTGSKLIVFGGHQQAANLNQYTFYNTGSIYDPVTDTWKAISTTNAPQARTWHAAVWTGTHMIVFGGLGKAPTPLSPLNDGGIYDPATDTWSAMSTVNAPTASSGSSVQTPAFWTGNKMVACCWATNELGAYYDPPTDTWTALPTANQPVVYPQGGMGAVVGNEYVWFGGYNGTSNTLEGGVYNYLTNSWSPTSKTGTRARSYGMAVSTGAKAFFLGGFGMAGTGDLYDPATNTWEALPPAPGSNAETFIGVHGKAFWTPLGLVAFSPSGYTDGTTAAPPGTHYRYEPATKTWTALSMTNSPVGDASSVQGVWTGSSFIYIGSSYDNPSGIATSNSGGIFK